VHFVWRRPLRTFFPLDEIHPSALSCWLQPNWQSESDPLRGRVSRGLNWPALRSWDGYREMG